MTSHTKKRRGDTVDLTMDGQTIEERVQRVTETVKQVDEYLGTLNNISLFDQFNNKAKEIEDFLVDEPVNIEEMMEASKKLAEIHKEVKAGKQVDPQVVGSVYAALNAKLDSIQKNGVKRRNNPLTPEEMSCLWGVARKYQKTEAKRLSVTKVDEYVQSGRDVLLSAAKDMSKLQELAREMQTIMYQLPLFNNKKAKDLEKALQGHLLGIIRDVCAREAKSKNEFKNLELEIKNLAEWMEERTQAFNIVITYYYCKHALRLKDCQPDDRRDDLERLAQNMEEHLNDSRIMSMINEVVHPFEAWPSNPYLSDVLFLPFYAKFALQEDKNMQWLFLGEIPCHKLVLPADSPDIKEIIKILSCSPTNTHLLLPKVLCILQEDAEVVLVVENIPVMEFTETIELLPKVSTEHKRDMLIGVSWLLDTIAQDGYYLHMYFTHFKLTRDCQITLLPDAFKGMFTKQDLGSKLPESVGHPDQILTEGYHVPYIGWLLQIFEFRSIPCKSGDMMIVPRLKEDATQAQRIAKELLDNFYAPNTTYYTRPFVSATQHLLRCIYETYDTCILSSKSCNTSRFETINNDLGDLYEDEIVPHGVDLGSLNRKSNHVQRLWHMMNEVYEVLTQNMCYRWNFDLTNERDEYYGGRTAIGNGPFLGVINDFMTQVLNHVIFEEINGKLTLAVENKHCNTCGKDECEFFGIKKTYEVIGRVFQTCLLLDVPCEKPFALFTVASFLNPTRLVITRDMCYELFPLCNTLNTVEVTYGDLIMGDNGYRMRSLYEAHDAFGFPNLIKLKKYFPVDLNVSVPAPLVYLYLMDYIDQRAKKSQGFANWIANGLGQIAETKVWTVLTRTPPLYLYVHLGTHDFVSPVEFIKKIKYSDGMEGKGRQEMFSRIMTARDNNKLRKCFLKAVAELPNITSSLEDKSIKVGMFEKGKGINELHETYGGMDVHSCFKTITLPYFETEDQLLNILLGIAPSQETGVDFYSNY